MKLFNNHTHTMFSHDGKGKIEDICTEAVNKNIFGFAVTDHCDCEFYYNKDVYIRTTASFDEAKRQQIINKDRLIISCGTEIGEAIYKPEFAESVISARPWDVILGSVHAVRYKNYDMPFSRIDFSDKNSDFLSEYIKQYFKDMKEMIESQDFDVLSHLTVPVRYINGRYKKNFDISVFMPEIENILKEIIKREKTLELNTSGSGDTLFYPDAEILKLYKDLGGERISLGSDSHTPENLTQNLFAGAELLKNIGFYKITYCMGRKPVTYNL